MKKQFLIYKYKVLLAHIMGAIICSFFLISAHWGMTEELPSSLPPDESSSSDLPILLEGMTYGTPYYKDESISLAGPHSLAIGLGWDVSNPYIDIYNLSTEYLYDLDSLFQLGFNGQAFISSTNRYSQILNNQLDLFGFSTSISRPQASAYLIAAMRPLHGRINFFSLQRLPVHLSLKAGPGYRWRQNQKPEPSLFWSFATTIYGSSKWGYQVGVSQEIEFLLRNHPTLFNSRLDAALVRRF